MSFSPLRASAVAAMMFVLGFADTGDAQTAARPSQARPKPAATKPTPAPEPPKPTGLTNVDVIQMVAAKLSEDVILNTIEDAHAKAFDLSPAGLVALKNGGVSDEVLRVMQGRPRTSIPALAPIPTSASAAPTPEAANPRPAPTAASSAAPSVEKDESKKSGGGVGRFLGGGLIGMLRGGKKAQDNDASTSTQPKKLEDGETAIIHVQLSEADATARVKAYFNSKDVDFTVNPETSRVISDWFNERRCGPGFHRCANKANVRILTEEGQTTLRVQVFERKREGGMNQKPWKEDTNSKGKETGVFAVTLQTFLTGAVASK